MPDSVRLSTWCQNADAGLSDVIRRCLGAGDRLLTLPDLRQAVLDGLARIGETRPLDVQAADAFIAVSRHRILWRRRMNRFSPGAP